ncbi:MAG TPA: UvrD-helicase domain-containing protein, partial [Planctomycetaceae bacterium]|nr:UvrD-helicase domain-containing protein [Planctomycetaceae bacterium]
MSGSNWTAQQTAAITARKVSVALSAGAGCGKTFVLTQRFLAHLEPGDDQAELRSLAAITFTDRAAREMRDRIRATCQKRLETCTDEDVEHWLGVLRGLDAARISTIHSFCTGLLRAHAVEAQLDPRFTVLEPALADTLREEAAKTTLHRLLIAEDPDAEAYVLRFGLERTRALLTSLIAQRYRVDWSQPQNPTTEELAQRWLTAWRTEIVPQLARKCRDAPCADAMRKLLAEHVPTHAAMRERCLTLIERLTPEVAWTDALAELSALREAAKVQGGGGKSAWPSEEIYDAISGHFKDFRAQIDQVIDKLDIREDDVTLAAELACQGLRLTRHAVEEYEKSKQANAALDFDDLLLRARDLLRDHPAVRDRLGAGLRLLMVDEFQDTDPVQAEIVRMLCGAALKRGKLFLVGDHKQSIYRFRRADPEVFRALRDEMPTAGRLSLTTNFRSQPEILRFVNFLFHRTFPEYEPLVPFHAEQLSPKPTIEFLFAHQDAEPTSPDETDDVEEEDDPNAAQLRAREADWIARRIAVLLADPTPRVRTKDEKTGREELRRVAPGDIVILFRALTHVSVYENALRTYGLDYYLVGGKTFYSQQEVFDLLNLCRCLDDPDDVVALIGVLRSPFFGFTDDTLMTLRPEDGDWWTRLQAAPPSGLPAVQLERVRFAGSTLAWLRSQKDRLPITELLNAALERTGYDAALLAEFLGSRKVANLRKLIDQAATFDRAETFTLRDFVHRLQTSVLAETDEEFATTLPESGAVIRLMSVHQSKGLEFPVVVVADINRYGRSHAAGAYLHSEWGALVRIPKEFGEERPHLGLQMLTLAEQDADQEETLRLFYVALTRAADHLILSAGTDADRTPKSPWMRLLAERFHLDSGLPKHDALLGSFGSPDGPESIPDVFAHKTAPVAQRVEQPREHIPLAEIFPAFSQAEPAAWPESSRLITEDQAAPRWWNVSQLEQLAEAQFPGATHVRPELRAEDAPAISAEALGVLIHAVMETCDLSQPDAWLQDIAHAARRAQLDLTPELQATASRLLERLGQAAVMQEVATARTVLREVEFVYPHRPVEESAAIDLISGTCDLVYQTATGEWKLLDFKTGRYDPAAEDAALIAPYRWQMALYAWAFRDWQQQPLASISLVYLQPQVRVVTVTLDTATEHELQRQLN